MSKGWFWKFKNIGIMDVAKEISQRSTDHFFNLGQNWQFCTLYNQFQKLYLLFTYFPFFQKKSSESNHLWSPRDLYRQGCVENFIFKCFSRSIEILRRALTLNRAPITPTFMIINIYFDINFMARGLRNCNIVALRDLPALVFIFEAIIWIY